MGGSPLKPAALDMTKQVRDHTTKLDNVEPIRRGFNSLIRGNILERVDFRDMSGLPEQLKANYESRRIK
jgi:hypothetical protein